MRYTDWDTFGYVWHDHIKQTKGDFLLLTKIPLLIVVEHVTMDFEITPEHKFSSAVSGSVTVAQGEGSEGSENIALFLELSALYIICYPTVWAERAAHVKLSLAVSCNFL